MCVCVCVVYVCTCVRVSVCLVSLLVVMRRRLDRIAGGTVHSDGID